MRTVKRSLYVIPVPPEALRWKCERAFLMPTEQSRANLIHLFQHSQGSQPTVLALTPPSSSSPLEHLHHLGSQPRSYLCTSQSVSISLQFSPLLPHYHSSFLKPTLPPELGAQPLDSNSEMCYVLSCLSISDSLSQFSHSHHPH